MNWDAIGAIGEVLGAILVAGTLIYLVIQVRQNTNLLEQSQKSGRVSADVEVVRLFSEWRMFSTQDGELADVFLRGLDDIDSLSPNEALRFNNLMQTFFWTCWQVLRLEDEGLFSMPNTVLYKDVLAHPGARAWYLSTREQFGTLINSTFDPILEEIERTGYQHAEVDGRIVSSLLGGPVPNRQ